MGTTARRGSCGQMSERPLHAFVRLAVMETDDCVIWPHAVAGQRGYGRLHIGPRHAQHAFYTHRLALSRRIPPPSEDAFALHGLCNTPRCMNYRHLRWGTPQENQADRHRDGTVLRGERNPGVKLTDHEVEAIRARYVAGTVTQQALADEYGVAQSQISRIVHRRRRDERGMESVEHVHGHSGKTRIVVLDGAR